MFNHFSKVSNTIQEIMKIEMGLGKKIYLTLKNDILCESAMEKACGLTIDCLIMKPVCFYRKRSKQTGKTFMGGRPWTLQGR